MVLVHEVYLLMEILTNDHSLSPAPGPGGDQGVNDTLSPQRGRFRDVSEQWSLT